MILLREIVDYCKAIALASRLSSNEASDWRYFCREYSKMFHTPLNEVLNLSPEHVIMSVFEEQLEKKNLNIPEEYDALVEEVQRLEDPNFDANAEKEMDDFVKGIEAFEEERVASGAPIPRPKGLKKAEPVVEQPPEEDIIPDDAPKQGYVDLSKFANEEEES